ncbi:MAG: hypothetical protein ABF536_02385 [Liquorilactobacillus mali]|uniref:hypothetical protein n=1 Tax=Liquorilactobacillus mali TaxID=1618 RepID=UPI0039ECCF37
MKQVKLTRYCGIVLLFFEMFFVLWMNIDSIKAAEFQKSNNESNKVLLVYDSKNIYYNGERTIDSVQRLLTSLGMETTTTTISKYKQGTLKSGRYKAVITLINWKSVNFTNKAFINDRQNFRGSKIHIGQNLQTDEMQGLGASVGKIVRQQLMFENNGVLEQLPYTDSMEALTNIKGNYLTFGTLQLEGSKQVQKIPFGIINNNSAYLPFWKTTGLGLVYEQELLTEILHGHNEKEYQPMLVITNVTPLSNLKYLKQLIKTLYKNGIHFALSATINNQNTKQKAFTKYIDILKYAENNNGIVYLRAPYLQDGYLTNAVTNKSLKTEISKNLQLMYQNQIYSIGIAAPNYWNHDKILANAGLKQANEILLLASPQVYPDIAESKNGEIYHRTYYVASLAGFERVKATHSLLTSTNMKFKVPTALNINLPRTHSKLLRIEKDIANINLSWYDFSTDPVSRKIKIGNNKLVYQLGMYYVNGKQRTISSSSNRQEKKKENENLSFIQEINHIFKWSSKLLLVIVVISLVGLIGFLIKGRRVYLDKFRKK